MKNFLTYFLATCSFIFLLTACSKNEILDHYNQTLQNIGDNSLTKENQLLGQRNFGEDCYVGSYTADYEDFSGTEILFGGTGLERTAGNKLTISGKLKITSGTAMLVFQSGVDDPVILTDSTEDFSETIELPSASNYILVEGSNFSGAIDLEVK